MSIKELDARVVAIYSQDMRKKCEESFLPFKYMCRTQNVSFSICSLPTGRGNKTHKNNTISKHMNLLSLLSSMMILHHFRLKH